MGAYRPAHGYAATHKDAVHAAATATEKRAIFVAPVKCRVTGVTIISDIAVTGDNTNTTNANLINAGAAGVGTTEVGNLDFVTGVNAVALDGVAIPLNATYANGADLNEGDVLALQYEKVGTGVAIGPSLINVEWCPV